MAEKQKTQNQVAIATVGKDGLLCVPAPVRKQMNLTSSEVYVAKLIESKDGKHQIQFRLLAE